MAACVEAKVAAKTSATEMNFMVRIFTCRIVRGGKCLDDFIDQIKGLKSLGEADVSDLVIKTSAAMQRGDGSPPF